MADTRASSQKRRIKLPGFGYPIKYDYNLDVYSKEVFPDAIRNWTHEVFTAREFAMLSFMEQITDKPSWNTKVRDTSVVDKWREEALAKEWKGGLTTVSFSDGIFRYCMAELLDKATIFENNGLIPTLNMGACVVKSDTAIDPSLKDSLKTAVSVLESVPDQQKDWHPGSHDQVLDLVHPSLFPLIYGRSRVLADREVGLTDCLNSIGDGETVPIDSDEEVVFAQSNVDNKMKKSSLEVWSHKYQ